ncbi:MAG: rhomboid family intramembrane serine protease [Bacteroidia bacterium]|nr:rhomboid family intramembrane serine protease [Bacteroidia bacterium]
MGFTVEIATLILMLVNFIFSYQGFVKESWMSRYLFQVEKVAIWRQYYRLISSGFLHVDWIHLIMNMYVLYAFSGVIFHMPVWYFLLLYTLSLVGGNLLALYLNRRNPSYTAVGASGAVNGVIFAGATLEPTLRFDLFFFIPMIFWVFAVLYLTYSIWGITTKRDNIGHEAHLGGAIVGIVMTIIFEPSVLQTNGWAIGLMMIPILGFGYIVLFRPEVLLVPSLLFKRKPPKQPTHVSEAVIRPMRSKNSGPNFKSVEEEIDYLLDKGVDNLTPKEKRRLDELSGNI